MASRVALKLACLACLVVCMARHVRGTKEVFDVTKYAASSDGSAEDNSKAFSDAWNAACHYDGAAALVIPKGTFLVGPIDFKGPCVSDPSPSVQILGELKAPTSVATFSGRSSWIEFSNLHEFVLNGGGIIDGQGAETWKGTNCQHQKKCKQPPISVRFMKTVGGQISNLTLRDSKGFHVAFHHCSSITIDHLNISAPSDSPNTDGIHISGTVNINVTNIFVGTGDDCISIGPGSINVSISDVTCGPGHGISVGSLGKYENEENVVGVKVKNCTLSDTTNGLRIKTWPASPPSEASNITFEDIILKNVSRPIIIDQDYCPIHHCSDEPSRVKIRDVVFSRVTGTTISPIAVTLSCSSSVPCKNVQLQDINLDFVSSGVSEITSSCSNVAGKALGTQNPEPCL
ncbi:exopolygalacturonase-like isoform X1 [Typha latifolia]|uniref:exopolygalacturonase-like isoform X1 n=1 Tax=Typha latifolia TaxID=4733 RepID=UPI003C30C492